jgi:spore maturation protein CgeB
MHPGIGFYEPQSIPSLSAAIDYYLEHDDLRVEMARQGYEWTRTHATWHQRLPEVFRTIGLRERED